MQSTQIQITHPPVRVLENSFSQDILRTWPPAFGGERDPPLLPVETPLPLITAGSKSEEIEVETQRSWRQNSGSHRQQVAKTRLGTRLFPGLWGAPITSKENTRLTKASAPLWTVIWPFPHPVCPVCRQSTVSISEPQGTEHRAPCHKRPQNRALSPGRQGGFYGTALCQWQGGTSAELEGRTQSSCPILNSTAPAAHGGVSLFLWADFEMFSLQSGNVY